MESVRTTCQENLRIWNSTAQQSTKHFQFSLWSRQKHQKRLSQVIFTFPEICSVESTAIAQPKRFCLKTRTIDMMSIHESQVFELRVEMRIKVCDPRFFF